MQGPGAAAVEATPLAQIYEAVKASIARQGGSFSVNVYHVYRNMPPARLMDMAAVCRIGTITKVSVFGGVEFWDPAEPEPRFNYHRRRRAVPGAL
jgi:hypothetical protein